MSTFTEKLRRLAGGSSQPSGPMQAVWNGVVIAESDRTIVVESNHYFPPEDVQPGYLEMSSHRTTCPWKGTASYYDVVVDGKHNRDAAWYYPVPERAAAEIKDHVAFWHGVKVSPAERA